MPPSETRSRTDRRSYFSLLLAYPDYRQSVGTYSPFSFPSSEPFMGRECRARCPQLSDFTSTQGWQLSLVTLLIHRVHHGNCTLTGETPICLFLRYKSEPMRVLQSLHVDSRALHTLLPLLLEFASYFWTLYSRDTFFLNYIFVGCLGSEVS